MKPAFTLYRHSGESVYPFGLVLIIKMNQPRIVIPAQAGIQARWYSRMVIYFKNASIHVIWIPACAGMTGVEGFGTNK